MNAIEKSGKTPEDAIKAGLLELGCDSSEVVIDVLDMGSPGLFGMFGRLARVRITKKEEDPALDFEMPEMSLDAAAAPSGRAPKAAKPEAQPQAKPAEAARRVGVPRPAEPPRKTEPPRRAEAPQKTEAPRRPEPRGEAPREPVRAEESWPIPEPQDINAFSELARRAYDFLKTVTGHIGVDVNIYVEESDGLLSIQMLGDELGILIGRRGETLDALQYLTSLLVNEHRDAYVRVSLDSEHYRAKREDALGKLAQRMAARARKTGHSVTLEPMNPYERRILHSALQDNPYVTTHSEGEEPYRRVVITLK